MLETMISLLAIVCSISVAAMGLHRWWRTSGFRARVYLGLGVFSGVVALANASALAAADTSFVQTATLAYVGFATAILLSAARALGNLTYDAPPERHDAAV